MIRNLKVQQGTTILRECANDQITARVSTHHALGAAGVNGPPRQGSGP